MEELILFIGNVEIKGKTALAPMAGVTDRAFRRICHNFGAAYVVGEMVSSKGISYKNTKSDKLLELDADVHPAAVQLFGDCPKTLAAAAEYAMKFSPDIIDINMGCPAPKIAGNNSGSALMRNPALCMEIVRAVSSAVETPVTAKIRKGYSADEVNAVEVAKACEQGGAAAITVHGRTREQMYAPPVDWGIIRDVKNAVNIPVIGNGDVVDVQSASLMYEHTGCDLIMIGRGALGRPWIFSQIEAWLNHEKIIPDPSMSKKMLTLMNQVKLMIEIKGEKIAMQEARKHTGWYLKGFKNAAAFRSEASSLETFSDLERLCFRVLELG